MNADIQRLFIENGIRHPCLAIVKLVVIGLMCRLVSVEQICVLARTWWSQLKEPLGFTRNQPLHPTTVTRLLGRIDGDDLSAVFQCWMSSELAEQTFCASVDGKTANNACDEQGIVSGFAIDLKQSLAGFEVQAKLGEPTVLVNHLSSLFERYPGLRLLTGDAYYAARTLCQSIVDLQRDYLMAVKGNAGELYQAIQLEFVHLTTPPAACDVAKKGGSISYLSAPFRP